MKISVKLYRVVAKMILVIAVIVFVCTVVFVGLQVSGKSRLYHHDGNAVPDLSRAVFSEEVELQSVETAAMAESEQEDWQEGDVRYQGTHYRYNKDTLTFLFLGIDKLSEVKPAKNGIDGGQSDAIFLLVLDPHSKEASVIGIPRDTMAEIVIYGESGEYIGNATAQLTLQHGYGDGAQVSCERSVDAVSKLFYDLPIHGYCAINMGAIPLINDAVGGVEVTALEDVIYTKIKEGQVIHLQGQDAYYYLHNRDTDSDWSAVRRLERQKQYLTAYAETAISAMKDDITLPVKLYNTISKYMVTDISIDEVSYLATQVGSYHFGSENFHTLQGETKKGEVYEEFYPDETALYELILDVFYEEVE